MPNDHYVQFPPDHPDHSSEPPSALASAPVDLEPLVDELARVLNHSDEATLLAQRARVPPGWIPAFDLPQVFWHRVIKAAEDGRVSGGAAAITGTAAKLYPDNPVFCRWARLPGPSRPNRAQRSLVAVLLGLVTTASTVAAWWPSPTSDPDEPEPVATNAHSTPAAS